MNKAICVFNDYSHDHNNFLPGVAEDKKRIRTMLTEGGYDIEEVTNENDIEKSVVNISQKWKDQAIDRLHFHFSGHGSINQTVNTKGISPGWDCIIGDDGTLIPIHRMKCLLAQLKPEKLTIILDCCRNFERSKKYISTNTFLQELQEIPISDWKNMVTFYSTPVSNTTLDTNSFSKELWKLYGEKNHHIPVTKIASLINKSWSDREVDQICTSEIFEVNNNWKGIFWPTQPLS